MATLTDERPDIEVIESTGFEPTLWHCYCGICNPGELKAGAVAMCGHVRTGGASGSWSSPPAGEMPCVVCKDLGPQPCPRCGW